MSQFEELPDDIFNEIFIYFTSDELYQIFSSLNHRFDRLLSGTKYLQIVQDSPEDFHRHSQRYFSRASRLIVVHSKKFFDPIQCALLQTIRCLMLVRPTREQWDSIDPSYFPNLQCLHLLNSGFVYRTDRLCHLIFSNGFTSLHTCTLPHVPYPTSTQWTMTLTLRSLSISILDVRVFNEILLACPNLTRLKLRLAGDYQSQSNSFFIALGKEHVHLRQFLLLPSNSIDDKLLEMFLCFLPSLEDFLLRANHPKASSISLVRLATIFEQRTKRLTRLRLDITLTKEFCTTEHLQTDFFLFRQRRFVQENYRPFRLSIDGKM